MIARGRLQGALTKLANSTDDRLYHRLVSGYRSSSTSSSASLLPLSTTSELLDLRSPSGSCVYHRKTSVSTHQIYWMVRRPPLCSKNHPHDRTAQVMFYTGKSTACHTCRQRRLKCDEVRPNCLKCKRAGRECLGYRDESAFIIRDMTTATILKFGHRPKASGSAASIEGSGSEFAAPCSAESSPADSGFSQFQISTPASDVSTRASFSSSQEDECGSERDRRRIRKQKSLVGLPRRRRKGWMVVEPTLLAMPLEDRAFCYFANRYALAPTQYLDPGYLPVLKVVSQKKPLGSCLSCSLSAVSLAAFSTNLNAREAILRARAAYATALQMTNEAIQQPNSCDDDELLASVVLLALFEVCQNKEPSAAMCLQLAGFLLRQYPWLVQPYIRCCSNAWCPRKSIIPRQVG